MEDLFDIFTENKIYMSGKMRINCPLNDLFCQLTQYVVKSCKRKMAAQKKLFLNPNHARSE